MDKFDRIQEHIIDIKETLTRNTATLERNTDDLSEHIRRTNLLEAKQDAFQNETEERIDAVKVELRDATTPIRIMRAIFSLRTLKWLGAALGLALAANQIWPLF